MKFDNVKIGEVFYGCTYQYNYSFLKGIALLKVEIVKINKKSVTGKLTGTSNVRRVQLFQFNKEYEAIDKDPIKILKSYIESIEKFKDVVKSVQKNMINYCKRTIKKYEQEGS